MIDIVRPTVRDSAWIDWIRGFPELPARTRYSLEWTVSRLLDQEESMPPAHLLDATERLAVGAWLERLEFEFELEQEDPVRIVDPLTATGVAGILIGVASATLIPPLSIGLFVASSGLLGAGISSKLDERKRRKLVKRIRRFFRQFRSRVGS